MPVASHRRNPESLTQSIYPQGRHLSSRPVLNPTLSEANEYFTAHRDIRARRTEGKAVPTTYLRLAPFIDRPVDADR